MFNLSGSEIVVILLLALVVLGPEKLPDAIRRVGRVYAELRRMGSGFRSEFESAFQEPVGELRQTAEMTKDAVRKMIDPAVPDFRAGAVPPESSQPSGDDVP